MASTKYNLFTIFLTISLTNAKNIKLEIDSKDLASLLRSVLESDALQNFASQIMRRSLPQTMYNPYHPEDGVGETSVSKTEPKKLTEENESKENKKTEKSLENDNQNFIKDGNKSPEQELVVDSQSPDEVKLVPVKEHSGKNSSKVSDMYNFHSMQRRFQLKDA